MCLAETPASRRRDAEAVRRELQDLRRVRAAFADADLLDRAEREHWDQSAFDAAVKEKLFGKPDDSKPAPFDVPMQTNAETCRIMQNWTSQRYRREGLPDIVRQAHLAHEAVHSRNCSRLPRRVYLVEMNNHPRKFSADEVEAYDAAIAVLEGWLRSHGPLLETYRGTSSWEWAPPR